MKIKLLIKLRVKLFSDYLIIVSDLEFDVISK